MKLCCSKWRKIESIMISCKLADFREAEYLGRADIKCCPTCGTLLEEKSEFCICENPQKVVWDRKRSYCGDCHRPIKPKPQECFCAKDGLYKCRIHSKK